VPGNVNISVANIIGGTAFNPDTVNKAIDGCEAVISTLNLFSRSQGLFGKITTPLDTMSVSIKNTVDAMTVRGIKRIVVMTALGVGDSANDLPGIFSFLMKISNIKYSYADHDRQEKVLGASDREWTVVRPVGLNDKNDNLSILSRINGIGKINHMISRKAVACFLIDCVEKGLFVKQKPAISNS